MCTHAHACVCLYIFLHGCVYMEQGLELSSWQPMQSYRVRTIWVGQFPSVLLRMRSDRSPHSNFSPCLSYLHIPDKPICIFRVRTEVSELKVPGDQHGDIPGYIHAKRRGLWRLWRLGSGQLRGPGMNEPRASWISVAESPCIQGHSWGRKKTQRCQK